MFKIKNKKRVYLGCFSLLGGFFVSFLFFVNQTHAAGVPQEYLKKIELKDRIYKIELDTERHLEFFDIYTKYYYKNQEIKLASGSTIFNYIDFSYDIEKKEMWGINRGAIIDYIGRELIPKYNREMQPVRIYRNSENGKIEFEGFAVDGKKIKVDQLTDLIIHAIKKDGEIQTIIIPFQNEPAKVTVEDEELQKLGIKELVAMGESDYSVSSWRRITNIRIGAGSFNGKLLQKDEIFSIGKQLGRITSAKGYKSEMVIKGKETIPELGGGLCQVGTTAFRAALQGGFEIVERWPHSYAVFHYEPFGTDATIYPPSKDFKFKNDSGSAILMQTHLDEEKEILYVNILGTKDARKVDLFGPYVWHWKYPGGKKYETDPNKLYWQNRIINEYYNGFSAYWKRIVSDNGTGSDILTLTGATLPEYDIYSTYKPAHSSD